MFLYSHFNYFAVWLFKKWSPLHLSKLRHSISSMQKPLKVEDRQPSPSPPATLYLPDTLQKRLSHATPCAPCSRLPFTWVQRSHHGCKNWPSPYVWSERRQRNYRSPTHLLHLKGMLTTECWKQEVVYTLLLFVCIFLLPLSPEQLALLSKYCIRIADVLPTQIPMSILLGRARDHADHPRRSSTLTEQPSVSQVLFYPEHSMSLCFLKAYKN